MIDQILVETAKVLAQLVGTAAIAWFAVSWALRRFKREKTWEHQMAAYTRVVAAIGEMLVIVTQWIHDIETHVERVETYEKRRSERYAAAKVEFEQSVAIAGLILPDETYRVVAQLQRDLSRHDGKSLYEIYDGEAGLLRRALDEIVTQGQRALR